MIDSTDTILGLVAAANPARQGDPPAFEEVMGRINAGPPIAPPRRPRGVPPRRLALGVLCVLLAAGGAAALAATGVIRIGAAAGPAGRERPNHNPHVGYGMPLPHGEGLLPLAVPDPAGGPPWGMRYFTTSRGLGCVQVGRIVDGQLGILGRDGVFGDDGLFHALATDLTNPYNCEPLDARHDAFLAVSSDSFFASGPDPSGHTGCLLKGSTAARPECPPQDRRELAYGLLGPDGATVTYMDGRASRTQQTVGANGAYLIVLRPTGTPSGGLGSGPMPSAPITKVAYRNGQICPITQAIHGPGSGSCGLVGYTPASGGPRLPRRLATALHIQAEPHPSYTLVTVTFHAPAAISNINRSYVLQLRLSGACKGRTLGAQTSEDIRQGQQVTLQTQIPKQWPRTPHTCPDTVAGVVGLAIPGANAASDLNAPTETSAPSPGQTIGHFTLSRPPGASQRSRQPPETGTHAP